MAQRIYILPDRGDGESGLPSTSVSQGGVRERAKRALRRRAEQAQDAVRGAQHRLAGKAKTAFDRVLRVANERPLHFVAGVAGAAFALGVVLRIWRSKRHG